VIVKHMEDDGIKLLTGYWAIPNANREGSAETGDDQKVTIHPGSFFIIQLHKAQGALVWWDIRRENYPLISAVFDTMWSCYCQLRNFW
jgi:hypothetical protein